MKISHFVVLVFLMFTTAGWDACCYAQTKPASSNSGASEAARERANQIIQNNAHAQEAIKEAGDKLQEGLRDNSSSRSDDNGQYSECVKTGGLALAYMCNDPNWKCEMGVGPCTGQSHGSDGPSVSDAPYISDLKDKILPSAPVDSASDLFRNSQQLLQNANCVALMSTYRPGPARALPSECMTPAEAMSVYTPIGRSQPTAPSVPEPVIDGSQIPSVIDFTLGPSPSESSDPISPSLEQLAKQIHIDALRSAPAEPSPSALPSIQLSEDSQLTKSQEDPGTAAELSSASTEDQNSNSESDSSNFIDSIFEAGKDARAGLRNFQIQVGDRLRGITRDADGAPIKIRSQQDTKKDSIKDALDRKIDELLDQ